MAWALQCPLWSTTLGCVGKREGRGGERGNVRLQRLPCQSTEYCTDERTLVSKELDQEMQQKRVAVFHHLCSQKSTPWASYDLVFAMPSVLDHLGLCRGRGKGRTVRLERLRCPSTTCCTDDSTLASKAKRPEDATQTSGVVPSSSFTNVKTVGFLWLGLCNALCGRPLWVVWGGGEEDGERGAR